LCFYNLSSDAPGVEQSGGVFAVPAVADNATLSNGPAACPRLLIFNPSMDGLDYQDCVDLEAPPGPALTPGGLLLTTADACPPLGPPQPPKTVNITLETAPPGSSALIISSTIIGLPPGSGIDVSDIVCLFSEDPAGERSAACADDEVGLLLCQQSI
jgi:hypothetical protein